MQGAGQGIRSPWPLIVKPWPEAKNGGLDFRLLCSAGAAGPGWDRHRAAGVRRT
jgi:hypothetical protein